MRGGLLRGGLLSLAVLLVFALAGTWPSGAPVPTAPATDAAAGAVPVADREQDTWAGSWGTVTSHASDLSDPEAPTGYFPGRQTVRMAVLPSIGGDRARIRLSNTFNKKPVKVGHATVAHQRELSAAQDRPVSLTFGGQKAVTIGPGEVLVSDPVGFTVEAGKPLLVSMYFPDPLTTVAYHQYTLADSYSTDGEDHVDRAGAIASDTTEGSTDNLFRDTLLKAPWVLLSGVDVTPGKDHAGTVVALGDSQTDGGHSTVNANRRWPDHLGRSLQRQAPFKGVVNAGISGNRVLGPTDKGMVQRFERDVLNQPNVHEVVFYGGINDITLDNASAVALTGAVKDLAARAHQAGLTFTVATLPPFKGYKGYTEAREQTRLAYNEQIRALGRNQRADRILDLDKTLQDPSDPQKMTAAFVSWDKLHLSDQGTWEVANLHTPAATTPVAANDLSEIAAADLTGSGRADLIATTGKGSGLYHFADNGDGTFKPGRKLTGTWGFTDTVAGDFDGDGNADLVAHDTKAHTLKLWRGNGDGTFQAPVKLTAWKGFEQLSAGDVDKDGTTDLVAVNTATNELMMWRGIKNRPANPFDKPVVLTTWKGFTQTTVMDVNGDHNADLVATDTHNRLKYWHSNGASSGNPFGKPLELTGWSGFAHTTGADINGDRIDDLIAVDTKHNQLKCWTSDGNTGTPNQPRNPFAAPKPIHLTTP